jgi:hypothetical protein
MNALTARSFLLAICLAVFPMAQAQDSSPPRARLIVLTDIEADPDDAQSLVRLLLYSNEIDIEGLVATTSIHMRSEIHPASIRLILDAYDKVRANLLQHASGYPATAKLRERVVEVQPTTVWRPSAKVKTPRARGSSSTRWIRRIRGPCG